MGHRAHPRCALRGRLERHFQPGRWSNFVESDWLWNRRPTVIGQRSRRAGDDGRREARVSFRGVRPDGPELSHRGRDSVERQPLATRGIVEQTCYPV